VHRDGRYIIAVVLGGRSAGERDAHMRELINQHMREASLHRTATALAERPELRSPGSERAEQPAGPKPAVARASSSSRTELPSTGKIGNSAPATGGDPIQPLLVKTITYRTAPVQAARLAPMPQLVPAAAPSPRSPLLPIPTLPAQPATTTPTSAYPPAQIASGPAPSPVMPAAAAPIQAPARSVARVAPEPTSEATNTVVVAAIEPSVIAPSARMPKSGRSVVAKSDSARSEALRAEAALPETSSPEALKPEAVKRETIKSDAVKPEAMKPEAAKAETVRPEVAKVEAKPVAAKPEAPWIDITKPEPTASQIRARGGWVIQIGAFEGEDEAKQHLSEARLKIPRILASADPFTQRLQKGDKALYRARFAGFDKAMAEAACKELKRSEIDCMTVRN
jgi:D-alanyl-D-alanine carboxypeptidase